jgi:hypothetical protein
MKINWIHTDQNILITVAILALPIIFSISACSRGDKISLGQEIKRQDITIAFNKMVPGQLPGVAWAVSLPDMQNYLLKTTIRNEGSGRFLIKHVLVSHGVEGASKKQGYMPLITGRPDESEKILVSLVFDEGAVNYSIVYGDKGIAIEAGNIYAIDVPVFVKRGEATFKLTINDIDFGQLSIKTPQ